MLTGLLMLLAYAGRAGGQAAQFHAEYIQSTVATGGLTLADSANGIDVAVDGTAYVAVTRSTSGSTTVGRLMRTRNGASTVIDFAALTGSSIAHSAAAGVMDVELGIAPSSGLRSTGYLAGSYENGMRLTLADPQSANESGITAPTPGGGAGAFLVRTFANSSGTMESLAALFLTNSDGAEFLDVETTTCTNQTPSSSFPHGSNCGLGEYVAVGGYVVGDSEISLAGHAYLVQNSPATYASSSVTHDPTAYPFGAPLVLNGSSEAAMVLRIDLRGPMRPTGIMSDGDQPYLGPLMLIDGEGDDRILDVEIDPRTGDLVVCGYFSSDNMDFEPEPVSFVFPTSATPHAGGKDMFVAKYTVPSFGSSATVYPELQWVFVHGTSGDDVANAVAIDSDGSVYVTGTKHDSVNGIPGDIFIAKIGDPSGTLPQLLDIDDVWDKTYVGVGIDTGEDVTIDHLNRPVFTGQFGYETSGDVPLYFLNFDPAGGSGATVITHGGSDAYLLRLRPDTASTALLFDFAVAIGDNHDEVGTGVAPNPYNRGELVHCGSFGSSFSTTAYGVDFDPSSGTDIAFTAGKSDPFVNRFDHSIQPGGATLNVAIDVSNSNLINIDAIFEDLGNQLGDSGIVPQDTGVSLSLSVYSMQHPLSQVVVGTSTVDQYSLCVLPMTTINSTTAPLLSRAVQEVLLPFRAPAFGEDTGMDDALYLGGDLVESAQILSGTYGYTSACLIADMPNDEGSGTPPNLTAARDWAVDADRFDQINVLCVQGTQDNLTRNYAMEFACESLIDVPALNTSNPIESHLGFANNFTDVKPGGTSTQRDLFQDYLTRFLLRMTHCPGDYNLDGTANGPTLGQDWVDMLADYGSANPYTDWNFDVDWPLPFEDGKVDFEKFKACFSAFCP